MFFKSECKCSGLQDVPLVPRLEWGQTLRKSLLPGQLHGSDTVARREERCEMSYLFLGHTVDDVRGYRVPHVSREQGSRVVLGLHAGRAHLLPPGGHGLRVPRLVYSDWRQRESGKFSLGHGTGATNPGTGTCEHNSSMKSNFWSLYIMIFQTFSSQVLDCNSSLKQNYSFSKHMCSKQTIDLNH